MQKANWQCVKYLIYFVSEQEKQQEQKQEVVIGRKWMRREWEKQEIGGEMSLFKQLRIPVYAKAVEH